MDDEVVALLNTKVADVDDNDCNQGRGGAAEIDDCRSVSVVGKSDTSSSFSGTDDCSSSLVDDDSADEYSKTCIRVGEAYQAVVPEKCFTSRHRDDVREGVVLWRSSETVSSEQVSDYVQYACDIHHFSVEQALGLLLWHNHNVELARADLPNYEPSAEAWSPDDISFFEEAYKIHNKRFNLYSELLPHKTIRSIVDYYYTRYKRRSSSFSPINLRSSHVGAFSASAPKASATEEKPLTAQPSKNAPVLPNSNLAYVPSALSKYQTGLLLDPRIKVLPSLINPTNPVQIPVAVSNSGNGKSKTPFARPPRGLHLRLEELAALASSKNVTPPADPLAVPRTELAASISRLQQQRQRCNEFKRQLAGGIQTFRQLAPNAGSNGSITCSPTTAEPQWTKPEISLAVAAFRQYGANFPLIADFIGTKSEMHVRHFYQTFRNRYNLDTLLAEYEAERRNLNLFPSVEDDYLKRKSNLLSQRSVGNGVTHGSRGEEASGLAMDYMAMGHSRQQSERFSHSTKPATTAIS